MRREATVGGLRDVRRVSVPVFGAIGGLLLPALIYFAFVHTGPAAHAVEMFAGLLAESDLPITLVEDDIYDTANACDAVVCVSGTVTLQTALVGTPMVIVYKLSPLSYEVARRVVKVKHAGLANIVAGEQVARELIQQEASGANIAAEVLHILEDSEYRLQLRQGLARVWERIGPPGCAERVARMASEMSRGILHRKDIREQN